MISVYRENKTNHTCCYLKAINTLPTHTASAREDNNALEIQCRLLMHLVILLFHKFP